MNKRGVVPHDTIQMISLYGLMKEAMLFNSDLKHDSYP